MEDVGDPMYMGVVQFIQSICLLVQTGEGFRPLLII